VAHWALWCRKLYTWWKAGASGGTGVSGGAGFGGDSGFSGGTGFIGWYWFQWR
jgi:hypothetical protein